MWSLGSQLVGGLVLVCLLLTLQSQGAEGRKKKQCVYYRSGKRGPCDVNTGMRSVVLNLKNVGAKCAAIKTVLKPCRPRKTKRKSKKKEVCKYSKGLKRPCDPKTMTRSVHFKLKYGDRSCDKSKVILKPCKDRRKKKKQKKGKRPNKCRYDRRHALWSACDAQTNTKTKVLQLAYPNPLCPTTKTKTRTCGRKKKANNCYYVRQPWSPCDESTNTRQRQKVLTSGDPTECLPKKIVTKQCRKECRYSKGNWTECDPETNLKNQTLTPLPGSFPHCQISVHTKVCSPRAEMTAAKPHKCKYLSNEWSSCDPRSNTMTQTMTLKNGDPNVCQRSVKLTKKCRIACKFQRGNWSECDEQTGLTTRVDSLIKGRLEECDDSRQITKKCRKKACKYILSAWSECDPETNQRSRVKEIVKGDHTECRQKEIITKSCLKRDGRARCFFGSFGDFGPCTNGVTTKHRPVLQGGVECQRKAVITKACERS